MKISRQKPEDAKTERYIIIAMIMSENVCRTLKKTYQQNYFQSKITKEVSSWVMDFFKDYEDAPKQEIQAVFEMKSKAGKIVPDLEEEIEKFLSSISQEWEEWEVFNEQYYIDLANKYFKKRSYIQLSEQLSEAANAGDVDEADRRYSSFTKLKEDMDTSRSLLTKEGQDAFRQSYENRPPKLFHVPGALGDMIGPIERESFIGLLGAEKSGKTFHLMMFAKYAAQRGLKVAMIETGDLSHDQLDRRFNSLFTNKAGKEEDTGNQWIPVLDCLYNQMGECPYAESEPVVSFDDNKSKFIVDINDPKIIRAHSPCIQCWKDREYRRKFQGSVWWERKNIEMWTWREARLKTDKFRRRHKRGEIITDAFPMYSVKASDIRDWLLDKHKNEGKIFDVVIVDYPDILLPENKSQEKRHSENEKWMILREISQEFHNCVIVATQADAKAYGRDTLTLSNYSEDKRKYGHTTHFYAINVTDRERELKCSRLSTLILRESGVKITKQVTLLQNLSVANANITSFYGRTPI